jgi:NitT/TauT family transport system ATP-binding protein
VVMAARPGRIVEDITIDLPRPRTSSVRALPRFGEIRSHAWKILKRCIREATELGSLP